MAPADGKDAVKVIAEIGNPPNLDWALRAVHAAADAGVWAVKGQLLRAHTLTTRTAPTYGQGLAEPVYQFDAFADAMPYSEWAQVKDRCDQLGVVWFASCWDEEAVDFCEDLGVEWYKVGSADITHRPLIEYIAGTGKRIMLSTGASYADEIEQAIRWIGQAYFDLLHEQPASVLQHPVLIACTLSYPCAPSDANVRRVETLRKVFGGEVGYSDHTHGWHASQIARLVGASYVEKHFTVTPGTGGDHDFAAIPSILRALSVPGLGDQPEWAYEQPEWGDGNLEPMLCELSARTNARRSIAAARDLPQGTLLHADDLTYLRPGTGIPPYRVDDIVGLPLPVDVPAGTLLPAGLVVA